MTECIVSTEALTKSYGDRNAVDTVSMTVTRGEIYGFLGPNGAGKTTTLRMLLGLIRPTSGRAEVLGAPPGDPAVAGRIGALIEGPGFYPYLSGRDNLRVLARYRRTPAAEVHRVLDRVDLTARAEDAFKTYSLGMKQRLGVAAAMLGDPDLLVLDEPTNGLDPAGMTDMRRLVIDLAADGHTIVLSSHLLAEVQDICQRVGVIAGGRLLREESVASLRGGARLRVRATPIDVTIAIGMRLAGDDGVRLVDDGVDLDLDPGRAPEVIDALLAQHVRIYEIRSTERSLEDVFFELTGPAAGAAPTTQEATR